MVEELAISEEFLIEIGLIALGLLIALYAIIVPNFKNKLIGKQIEKFNLSYNKLKTVMSKLDNRSPHVGLYENLQDKVTAVQKYNRMPFWIVWGVLLTVIFLSIASLLPLMDLLKVQNQIFNLATVEVIYLSGWALFLGIIGFIIIAVRVFLELKEILTGDFEEELEKANKIIEEAKEKEREIKK